MRITAIMIGLLLCSNASAAFEFRAGQRNGVPESGPFAANSQLDLFLVETTGLAFNLGSNNFNLQRSGTASESNAVSASFVGASFNGTDTYAFVNFGGGASQTSGPLSYVKVGQIDINATTTTTYTFLDPQDGVTNINVTVGGGSVSAEGAFGSSFTAVPEPSSALLLAIGCVGTLTRRRRG